MKLVCILVVLFTLIGCQTQPNGRGARSDNLQSVSYPQGLFRYEMEVASKKVSTLDR